MDIAHMLDHPEKDTPTRSETQQPRDIITSTSGSPISTPHTRSSDAAKTSTTKRRQIRAACLACRQRKSKCDGARPSCKICTDRKATCNYSVEQGMTQQQATKERLKSYKEVVALIRQSSQEDCDAIVRVLKSKDSLEDACNLILEGRIAAAGGDV